MKTGITGRKGKTLNRLPTLPVSSGPTVTGRFGPIPVRTPGRFGPIPFRSGRFGPILEVGRFGPILVGRFGPLYSI